MVPRRCGRSYARCYRIVPSQFIADLSGDGRAADAGVDLGVPLAMTKLHLNAGCGGTFRRFTLSGSDDALTWTVRYDSLQDLPSGDQGVITLPGGPYTHRFWKVSGNGTTAGGCGFQVFSLEIIGGVVAPGSGRLDRIREPAGNALTLGYSGTDLVTLTDTVGRVTRLSYARDLALGKPYTKSAVPNFASDDTGDKELTDGHEGAPNNYNDSTWVGYVNLPAPLDVTVDLGADSTVGFARSYYFEGGGVSRPNSVEILTSTDNLIFTSQATTAFAQAVYEGGARFRFDATFANATARYVRFRMTASTWLVTSEVEVYDAGGTPPGIGVPAPPYLLTQLADPLGRKVTYAYDTQGRLTTVTDKIGNAAGQTPSAHQWKYAHDNGGSPWHITKVTDPDGRARVTNVYDVRGRLKQQSDGLNNTTSYSYGASQTVVTDRRGKATTYTFDARYRVLTEAISVSGTTRTLTYGYDPVGNRNAVTDRQGNRTDYTYDSRGNILTKSDPSPDGVAPRPLTTFVYDSRNNPTQITDPRSFVTTNTYHATTNVLLSTTRQIDGSTSAVTKYEYTDATNPGLPTKLIAPRGNTAPVPNYAFATTLSYDAQANLLSRANPDGNQTTYGYDAAGRQTSLVDPDGNAAGGIPSEHTWTSLFDENDRVTRQTNPLGQFAQTAYDGAGNATSLTDRRTNATTYAYDAAARLATVQQKPDPLGQPTLVYTTTIVRDPNGNPTQIAEGNGVITDHTYDELDRTLTQTTHPAAGTNLTTSYVLNGNGLPTSRTTADGVAVTYGYDYLSRLTSIAATGLAPISYGYDAASNRTSMVDGTGTSTFVYDGLGRMTSAAQPNGTLAYGYDLDGDRTTLTYPGGTQTVTYSFTNAGRLDHLTDWASRVSTYTYQASGVVATLQYPNGLKATYAYDRALRLTSLSNKVGAATITDHAYTLDAEGNRTAQSEFVSGLTAPPVQPFASVKVNSDTGTAVQDHPAIAIGADGGTYLVWDDARSGNADIEFARRDPGTGTWGANVKVNTDTTTRLQLNPAIALDGSNNAYAVWEDERDGANNKIDRNVYFSKRAAGTGLWSTPNLRLNTDTTGNPVQRSARVGANAGGTVAAVWVDLRSNQQNIQSRRSSDGAGTWSANLQVTNNTAALKDAPDVAVGADGTAYAVWQDSRGGNPDIYFSKLPAGTTVWTANVKVSDDPGTAAQTAPRIGVDSAGNLTVIWLDARTTPATVRMSRQLAGTSIWTASVVASDPAARPSAPLGFSLRPDGNAVAAWSDTRAASTDIWAAQYTAATGTWAVSALLSDDPGSAAQAAPALAYTAGELVSAWRDDRAGNPDLRARRTQYNSGADPYGYAYDGLLRLTQVGLTNPESFTLDAASNQASRTGPAATYSYDTANRLTSDGAQSFTWNSADRLASRAADTFSYDPLGRQISSTVAGTPRTYAYNADGLLQSRTQGAATAFLWDPATSPSRLLQQGTDRIVYGLGPLYVVKADASTLALARDGGKSVRAEVNGSGVVTASFRYAAYGAIVQTNGATMPSSLGYAGQLQDPSGLLYMRARWYDPNIGRFITRDPLRGDPGSPATLNAYAYAGGNPLTMADPSGMAFEREESEPSDGPNDPGGDCPKCGGLPSGPGSGGPTLWQSVEHRVADFIGIPRNVGAGQTRVQGSGPGGYRIPDFDVERTMAARGTIVEVKAWNGRLRITPQIRDLAEEAGRRGGVLEIFTNAKVPMRRGELFDLIRDIRIVISELP